MMTSKERAKYMKEYRKKSSWKKWRKMYSKKKMSDPKWKLEKNNYDKNWYQTHKNKVKIYNEFRKEIVKEFQKEYRKKNKEKRLAYNRDYYKNKANLQSKLIVRLRIRLNSALRNNQKMGSAVKDLGCSINELKQHLESQFKEGMTWSNYGFRGWHIDHKKPLSLFNLENREDFVKAVHYTNLQPLWAHENLTKSCRYSVLT